MFRSAPLLLGLCLTASGQTLNFETASTDGWTTRNAVLRVDDAVFHGGKGAARLEPAGSGFASVSASYPIEFGGKTLTLRGYMRTEDVTGFAGFYMQEDGFTPGLEMQTMERQPVRGTTDWKQYSISVALHPEATKLVFGIQLSSSGKVWFDDLELLIDGKPVQEAPRVQRPKTALELDREFDGGSRVSVTQLSSVQVQNLVLLGKVWGFLKYHHPDVVAGKRHWDFDLFRALPPVLAAANRRAGQQAAHKWVTGIGTPPECSPCAKLETGKLHFGPALDWLDDQALLGADLSTALRSIHANRPADGRQFYVGMMPMVGNPRFDHEPAYPEAKAGDSGYQILAAFRFWNMIEYWFPYRDVIVGKWDDALREALPKIATAQTGDEYKRELMALIARVEDTHANLWSSIAVRPPVGACALTVTVRFAEAQPVIADSKREELQRGDVITELDGKPLRELLASWMPYYAASNGPTKLRDIARQMTRGACGPMTLKVRRGSEELAVKSERTQPGEAQPNRHDRPGDTFQRISPEVGYLKLSSVKQAEVTSYIDSAAGTKGLVIDIRNYPSEFMPFALGSVLVDKLSPFARFTTGDLNNPGAFHWTEPVAISPREPRYKGKIVILVDETSQSQSEYTTMALRTAPGAKIVGSTTAGADGNVSAIPLPGGLRSMISGIGVFYPDKRPTQKIGILPDVEVWPTIAGIREGRDEVLEEAIRQILKD
jgi:hypothetical protein